MFLKITPIILISLVSSSIIADELLEMQQDPTDWVMPAGNYNNQRYSKLSQITKDNVANLNMEWTLSTGLLHGHEGNILVIGTNIFIHTPFPNEVLAINAYYSDAINWVYTPKQKLEEITPMMCCDTVNRGLAYGDGKIFLNQADTTLVALDVNTGKEVWKHLRDDYKRGQLAPVHPTCLMTKY